VKNCAIVATHHKTGTVWMRSVFRAIAVRLDIPFVSMKKHKVEESSLPRPVILFNDHSNFSNSPWLLSRPDNRIFHVIRDPRDVMISAMHYHRGAKEHWLHVPREIFGGMTYQQKLNSYDDDFARFSFEMQHSTMRIIKDMCDWDYSAENCLNCRYEDMVGDSEMAVFTKILTHLGFEAAEMDLCLKQVWKHSLFGKKQSANSKHIRSGERNQWPKVFDRRLGAAFVEKFGDALVRLGYEPDTSWASRLPD
jgi:hypothetical protein